MQTTIKINKKQPQRLMGDVLLFQTPIFNWVTAFVLSAVSVSLLFLATGTYAKKTKVSGVVISEAGVVRVTAKAGGTIDKQLYKVGDFVKKGDVLFSISTKRQSLENDDLDEGILEELLASQSILKEKINNLKELARLQTLSLANEIEGKKQEMKSLIEQGGMLSENVIASKETVDGQLKLRRLGMISDEVYDRAFERDLNIRLKSEEMNLRISEVRNSIKQLDSQLLELPLQNKIQQNDLQQAISSTKQQIIDVLARRDYSITSPADGVIANSLTKIGQIVRDRQPLQTLIPKGSSLQAEIFLPSNAIGFVKKGQDVYMRYSAFPYQHFGLQKGVITEVSSVITQPAELEQGEIVKTPVYRAVVELDSQTVSASGENLPIHVGMTLEASIILDSRNIWEWIMEPIFSLKGGL